MGSILLCGLDDSRDDVDNRYGLIDARVVLNWSINSSGLDGCG